MSVPGSWLSTETGLDPAGPTLSHDFSDFSTLGGALPFGKIVSISCELQMTFNPYFEMYSCQKVPFRCESVENFGLVLRIVRLRSELCNSYKNGVVSMFFFPEKLRLLLFNLNYISMQELHFYALHGR